MPSDTRPKAVAKSRTKWVAWLQVVLALVSLYGVLLVVAGTVALSWFTALGFGPPASIHSPELSAYLRLPFAVLGAVLAGWAVLMFVIVKGPLASGARWAIPALAASLGTWFVLDTGMSLVLDYPTHALFNIPFAIALGLPLWRLWAIDRNDRGRVTGPRSAGSP